MQLRDSALHRLDRLGGRPIGVFVGGEFDYARKFLFARQFIYRFARHIRLEGRDIPRYLDHFVLPFSA